MTTKYLQIKLRIPPDMKAFLQHEVQLNASSQNSEIVRAIRERMKAKGAAEGATSPRQIHTNPSKGKDNERAPE